MPEDVNLSGKDIVLKCTTTAVNEKSGYFNSVPVWLTIQPQRLIKICYFSVV
jgi:hypothetical protein